MTSQEQSQLYNDINRTIYNQPVNFHENGGNSPTARSSSQFPCLPDFDSTPLALNFEHISLSVEEQPFHPFPTTNSLSQSPNVIGTDSITPTVNKAYRDDKVSTKSRSLKEHRDDSTYASTTHIQNLTTNPGNGVTGECLRAGDGAIEESQQSNHKLSQAARSDSNAYIDVTTHPLPNSMATSALMYDMHADSQDSTSYCMTTESVDLSTSNKLPVHDGYYGQDKVSPEVTAYGNMLDQDDNDDDTALKEKRGVVKRRSTPAVTSLVLPSNEWSDHQDSTLMLEEFSHMFNNGQSQESALLANNSDHLMYQNQPQPIIPPFVSQDALQLPEPRPGSSISNQEHDFFNDFDGVHFSQEPVRSSQFMGRNSRLSFQPSLAQRSSKDLVYYPAPVPMMLNLPPRLSKPRPTSIADPRRSMAFNNVQAPLKSGAANRASIQLGDIAIKDASAVATLDSLLDAAAIALPTGPVEEREPKPYHVHHRSVSGTIDLETNETTRYEKIKPDLAENIISQARDFGDQEDSMVMPERQFGNDPEIPDEHISQVGQDMIDEPSHAQFRSEDGHAEGSDSDGAGDFENHLPPPTLLAELEARKSRQRLRTKGTPLRLGTGMRSTLLELDAVAEIERESRRKAPTLLAWQHNELEDDKDMDDDVPLGLLFSGTLSARREGAQRMPGLLAKREMEDNEPLSKRRERLRHESGRIYPAMPRHDKRAKESTYTLNFPDMGSNIQLQSNSADEMEGETLAERRERLKATVKGSQGSGASLIKGAILNSDTNGAEGTLGERRRRLQDQRNPYDSAITENDRNGGVLYQTTDMKSMASMSNLLQMNPQRQAYVAGGFIPPTRGLLAAEIPNGYHAQQEQQQRLAMMAQSQLPFNRPIQPVLPQNYVSQGPAFPNYGSNAYISMGLGYEHYPQYTGPLGRRIANESYNPQLDAMADQRAREMVERWRTGVV